MHSIHPLSASTISMQARCQLQRRPTFLPSNFYFLRARRGGRAAAHHAIQRITKVARNARPTFARRLRHLQEVPLRRDYVGPARLPMPACLNTGTPSPPEDQAGRLKCMASLACLEHILMPLSPGSWHCTKMRLGKETEHCVGGNSG